jgi:hypothetical protein
MSKLPSSDPFGRSALPAAFSREDRIRLIGQAAHKLIESGGEAELFVGAALLAWLEGGKRVGDLERKFLRATPERGSHFTAQAVWAQIKAQLQRLLHCQ